jgi:putative transposase
VAAKQAGWRANHKRIHRLWIAEGLRVPYRKRKKPLRGIGQAVGSMCPIRPNVVWAMDLQFDQTREGRTGRADVPGRPVSAVTGRHR